MVPADLDLPEAAGPGPLAALGRRLLRAQLARLRDGEIRIVDIDGERCFGARTERCPLSATLEVLHPRFYADAAFGGTVGAGAAYIRGLWRCTDLTSLTRIMYANRALMDRMDRRWTFISRPLLRVFHWLHRNDTDGSERNIRAHYDLGNEFYRLMLDETMAYSCGIFADESTSLAEASRAKFDTACRKLALQPGDQLLEIGTGWGGLALHAARHYGCHVTTTTISREQHDYARAQIQRAGLGDRITLLLEDYRALRGRYDKLVSVEMIEAVGAPYLDTYLAKCAALLREGGSMLLQAITIQDQDYHAQLRSVNFIQRYVFPGSFIPSVSAIAESLRRATDLKIFHLEDIGPHYARTLALWRRNFTEHLGAVRRLGFSERFIRLWEFYLCSCEGGFAERALGDVQMLLTKPGCRRAVITAG
ncbi:MAG: class I SAM-dependent methyltransferase [Gammaproteobacteria bacterium]|nr:class I SAM-dependent methyltransferase [Gammaproteobacteria bacterium]MDE2251788.1 class I SAM-dependent methyltransferase [Gammaproteobacteria bacterium]